MIKELKESMRDNVARYIDQVSKRMSVIYIMRRISTHLPGHFIGTSAAGKNSRAVRVNEHDGFMV